LLVALFVITYDLTDCTDGALTVSIVKQALNQKILHLNQQQLQQQLQQQQQQQQQQQNNTKYSCLKKRERAFHSISTSRQSTQQPLPQSTSTLQ
jgi:PBP1b-binding outer membrane lipoprotein LpoB